MDSRKASEITPPSPTPHSRQQQVADLSRRPSYQPRSLVLVEKHLSANKAPMGLARPPLAVLAPKEFNMLAAEKVPVKKSTKGWKPRAALAASHTDQKSRSPVKKAPTMRPILTPGKKVRSSGSSATAATALKRATTVYSDEAIAVLSDKERKPTNSFLVGRALSTRRRDAFTAARRKLEGIGAPGEQTDRSSGTSENDEIAADFRRGRESGLLEARGSVDAVE